MYRSAGLEFGSLRQHLIRHVLEAWSSALLIPRLWHLDAHLVKTESRKDDESVQYCGTTAARMTINPRGVVEVEPMWGAKIIFRLLPIAHV